VRCAGRRQLGVLLVVLCGLPAPAAADWLLVPFAGTGFGKETTFTLAGGPSPAKTVFGVSGIWLSDQIFGVEADVMHGPAFFDSSDGLILDSAVSTLFGGVIAAIPLSVTRESLRPYVIGGVGLMHVGIADAVRIFPEDRTLAAIQVGGGAIGFVSPRTGYRFEARHLRSLSREEESLTGNRNTKLGFWRLTVGVLIRIG
jgi:hypothetical protein